jgi:hypothetical protein
MDPKIVAGIIGGACTVIAGIGGAIIGKSEKFDRIFRKNDLPNFVGTKWESKWTESQDNEDKEFKEYFQFTKQKGNKIQRGRIGVRATHLTQIENEGTCEMSSPDTYLGYR